MTAATGAFSALALTRGADGCATEARGIPIIDSHIHLFDANRPQGAPYVGPKEFTSHVSLPAAYRALASPLGIVGALAVEASPWLEDNLWVLEVAQVDPIMVGTVGFLEPDKPEFPEYLERYHRNPLYRGIRLRVDPNAGSKFEAQVGEPEVIKNLGRLSEADLVLDTTNPSLELLRGVIRVNDKVPDLRIIVDHLPVLDPTPAQQADYEAALAEIRQRPNIFVKLSEILHRVHDIVAAELPAHRERLDYLMSIFGEDRVLFASDYPNFVGTATLDQVTSLVERYFAARPRAVAEKFFWRNSLRCYKWVKRAPDQPGPT
jgi:predicted TIM-barrel fold metal-dependent hydrolase